MLTRRTFLGAAAALTAGAATACSGTTGDPRPTPTRSSTALPPPTTTATTEPGPPDWAGLAARLPGGLHLPGQPGYDAARRVYNPLFDGRRPAAVARCTRDEDVQACVEVAAGSRIPIAARSGGHSYAGYSNPDGALVVDLNPLSGVEVAPDGTAVVGAGTRLIDVYAGLAAAGRALPAGSCPTVGVAGLTLGGGIGVLARKYGLTCDRLVSARIVTAGGEVATVSQAQDPDLFWALRGGGGGNVGIVTSFTFATEPAPELTVFSLRFGVGADQVLGAWQNWVADLPDELWTNCVLSAGSPPGVRIGGCFVGDETGCRRQLDRIGLTATSVLLSTRSYLDAMRYFGGCSTRDLAQCHPETEGGQLGRESFVASSRILDGPVDPAAVTGLLAGRTGLDLLLDSLGGAVSAVAPGDTAFPHRGALASAQIYANTAAGARAATDQVGEVRDGLGALAGAKGYVNYIDPAMPDWADAYYGQNLPRLREVASRYDPDGVFAFRQGLTAPDR
ncbi:FAD-binding dehydrogenase [Actinophytocola xinjiangensis]|uniref:FAD-binding dehydrogenase n=1 Tax=Actinophytocola xinjiangensis TaxID=485602 RepID=A0A7Z1AV81_9PSEU|nr:FAD-binding oxidoreductase [Actinophytocola xinjiangensis]OLF04969.1 FAD-binding dehydrogenase [Actinophytocola xinjiangensis]